MSSEHVEVLRHMKETIKAIMPSEVAALDAAIASLSAPQPPAEAQPVAWRSQGKSGWTFTDMPHARDIAAGIWEPLYSAPPPSAPDGAVHDALQRPLRGFLPRPAYFRGAPAVHVHLNAPAPPVSLDARHAGIVWGIRGERVRAVGGVWGRICTTHCRPSH